MLDQERATADGAIDARSPAILDLADFAEFAVSIRSALVLQRDAVKFLWPASVGHGRAEAVLAAVGIDLALGVRAAAGIESVARAQPAGAIAVRETAREGQSPTPRA